MTKAITAAARRPLALSVLRDFTLSCGDTVIELAPTAQRLIGFLAMQGGPARRSFVSGSLWLDAPEQRAHASLRSALWRCPVIGGVPVVCATNTHLWLHPDLEVDLARATRRARALLDLPDLNRLTVDIDLELRVFANDVLVGWYHDWVLSERERFRQLRLHVLDRLGELLLARQRYPEAVQVGLVALSSEPLRESAHRLLVQAFICEGNLAEATRQYRLYADTLASELSVRPSAAMEELLSGALRSPHDLARVRVVPTNPAGY
jgi:DNA-binding SARP family transcriptional activator